MKLPRAMVFYLLLVVAGGIATGTAASQELHKNEVGLLLGGEVIPARNASSGLDVEFSNSFVFSANYARRLGGKNKAFYLEFPFAAAPSHKVTTPLPGAITDLATLYITPSLRVQFADRRTFSPWFSGGFGYGLYEGSQRLAGGTANPNVYKSVGTAQFGAGIDVRTPFRLLFPIGLRGEVRDYYTVSSPSFAVPLQNDRQHNIVAAGGIVLRF